MDKKEQKITTIIIVTLVTVVLIAGFYFLKPKTNIDATTVETQGGLSAQIVGADPLKIISQIKSLKLGNGEVSDLTDNPNFIGLVDTTVKVQTEEVRRENPFSSI